MRRLNRHFSQLVQPAFQRYGFAYGGLLSNWREIAGDDLVQICEPMRIVWPGGSKAQAGLSRSQKLGGILHLRVAYGRGLELQYQVPRIIDRINTYYGYQAVVEVRIKQGPLTRKPVYKRPEIKPLARARKAQLESEMANIEDDRLKTALLRLAKGVMAEKV